jgi:penicillin-binding protein 1C
MGSKMKKCILLLAPMLAAALFLIPWEGLPSFNKVQSEYAVSQGTQIFLDRFGQEFHRAYRQQKDRRQRWISLASVPEHVKRNLILIEDKHFYEHRGVDFGAFLSALGQWPTSGRLRGASTITMQLASLLQTEGRTVAKSLLEKVQQIVHAGLLEIFWTKPQILETYLNLATFRGDLVGIDAAAQGLFQKFPHGLSRDEGLILAALLSSPNARPDRVASKACLFTAVDECKALKQLALKHLQGRARLPRRPDLAPHFARLIQSKAPLVTTTLDSRLQQVSVEAVHAHLNGLQAQNVKDAAVIVANHHSGEILAYVGSSAKLSLAPDVDGVRALRQAGSTLKPLLYAQAIDDNLLTSETLLDDSPFRVQTVSGLYRPENYDRTFKGIVPARVALASSLNIPAVRVIDLLGIEPFYRTLVDLGFSLRPVSTYGHSLSLGAADVSLKQLIEAYTALAHGGRSVVLHIEPRATREGKAIFRPSTTQTISTILSSKDDRALTFGLDNPLATPYFAAVKTGTSKDMRDNWCLGYDDTYIVGVWVGNFEGSPMWDVSGISGAAPIWRTIMDALHPEAYKSQRPYVTELAQTSRPKPHFAPYLPEPIEILYPQDKALIAFDPDIPAENQAIVLEHSGSQTQTVLWQLDEVFLTSDVVKISDLASGRHRLRLFSKDRELLKQIGFEIRGKEAQLTGTR